MQDGLSAAVAIEALQDVGDLGGVQLEVPLDDASAAWLVAVLSGLRRSGS